MTMFLAVDLAEQVCTASLGGDEVDINSPGWPVRMPLGRMHWWLDAKEDAVIDELGRCVERWRLQASDVVLVVLSEVGRDWACRMAEAIGCRQVCIPRFRYMISPRGVVPAGILWEYSKSMTPARMDWSVLRNAFVDLLEQAADDVQAAKFEQDDSVVDRYAELRWTGGSQAVVVPVESLSDPQWLLSTLRETARDSGQPEPTDAAVEIMSLYLRCAVELPEMFPMPIAASDGRIERAIVLPSGVSTAWPSYDRGMLLSGDGGIGPATIQESNLAIPIADGWSWRINDMGQLICRLP